MPVELLADSVEIGVVTTNLAAMVDFYEGFLGLPLQGDLEFPGGSMKRYSIGGNVLKLVSYDTPPATGPAPGGGRAQGGIRYLTLVVASLGRTAQQIANAGHPMPEPVTEFAAIPGMGWLFVADPDGNWIELVGPL
jgi:catechol 2,3-dioxygenase-like lactoylglutathione lyase family enzyme